MKAAVYSKQYYHKLPVEKRVANNDRPNVTHIARAKAKLCRDCGIEPVKTSSLRCEKCLLIVTTLSKKRYRTMNPLDKERLIENANVRSRERYRNNRDVIRQRAKEYREKLKLDAYRHYGKDGKVECACCKESNILFLTIDHINNDGAVQRKADKTLIYLILKRKEYPKGYQVFCFNCNLGKQRNKGVCPHQSKDS